MDDTFTTVAGSRSTRIEVKRSVFLCTIESVPDEAAARAVVDRLRKEYWDARHHCSAFILGPEGRIERSNDDGEPAGTAGAPMLEVLRGAGLTDVVAVVTRWFGGTLLGAGGLVRAYSDAVRAAVAAADTRTFARLQEWQLALAPAEAGRVEADLRARGLEVLDVQWGPGEVQLTVGAPGSVPVDLLVAEATAGRAEAVAVGHRWAPAP